METLHGGVENTSYHLEKSMRRNKVMGNKLNPYVASVIDYVKATHKNEPEFVQTVEEVFSSISPIMDAHPEYVKADLLKRMVEPEREVPGISERT